MPCVALDVSGSFFPIGDEEVCFVWLAVPVGSEHEFSAVVGKHREAVERVVVRDPLKPAPVGVDEFAAPLNVIWRLFDPSAFITKISMWSGRTRFWESSLR